MRFPHDDAPEDDLEREPQAAPYRRAVLIEDDSVIANGVAIRFYSRHIDDVLVAFLELIRQVRGQAPGTPLNLRRADVEELSRYLNRTGTEVVNRLATLMGASRLREAAMVARYRAGDSVIETGVRDRAADTLQDQALPAETIQRLSVLKGD